MLPDAVLDGLKARYREPHRRYHALAHIEDCLAHLAALPDLSERDRKLLYLAIWWHDAVYDSTRSDNEDISADLAVSDLAAMGEDADTQAEVARLIRLTKGHRVPDGDRIGALLISIDLSILGAAPDRYDLYASAIREEYAHVPETLYRAGRASIMRSFLDATTLFPDPSFHARLEAQARTNIAREVATLSA